MAASFIAGPQAGSRIAYVRTPAAAAPVKAGVVFFPGLLSQMQGTKALALEAFVKECLPHCSYTRFDYRGHGESSGTFTGTHLGDWFEDALLAVDHLTDDAAPLIIVGSSMGGLLALHAALRRPTRVAGLVLVAPAAGFAARRWAALPGAARDALAAGGAVSLGSEFVAPGADDVNLGFFEAARAFELPEADGAVDVRCPVRVLHGALDDVVPIEVGQRLVRQLAARDVTLTSVKDGDHRLSAPRDVALLTSAVALLAEQLGAGGPR
ncbi:MAG: alpha/beta hydrolase fold protein [Monoraphidium minutum]|nr:MAG: alpha/beta hydrolase fold protein [Monoraphidium minutum]